MKAGKLPGVVEKRSLLMYTETDDPKAGILGMEPAQVVCSEGGNGHFYMMATD